MFDVFDFSVADALDEDDEDGPHDLLGILTTDFPVIGP